MAKRSWPESMRNAALLGLMQPNLETGARRTGRYTLFGLAGGNFREIGRFVWNLLALAQRGSVGRPWKVSSLPFFYTYPSHKLTLTLTSNFQHSPSLSFFHLARPGVTHLERPCNGFDLDDEHLMRPNLVHKIL